MNPSEETVEKVVEKESALKQIVNETFVYTIAEIHVQGILAGVAYVCRHALTQENVAVVITLGGAVIAARVHFKDKHLKIRLTRTGPHIIKDVTPVIKWEKKNF